MLFIPETVAQIPLNVAFKYDGSRLEAPLKNIFLAANASIIALQSIDPKVRHLGAGFATMHGGVLGLTIDFPCPQLFISSAGDDITPHLWIPLPRRRLRSPIRPRAEYHRRRDQGSVHPLL